jgi:colanic acid/amylovoran biosynthesis glycosyltransferase
MGKQGSHDAELNVIHSCGSWLPQTQTWMYNLVRFLPTEVTSRIVCGTTENLDQFIVPNIYAITEDSRWQYYLRYGLWRLRPRWKGGYLAWIAARYGVRLVHSHFGTQGWGDCQIVNRLGLKHIVTFYGSDWSYVVAQEPIWADRYHQLFERVDCVLCEGPYMKKQVVKLGCPQHKARVHHLGVLVDRIAFKPREWSKGAPLYILISGTFREKKGIPYALEALGRLQKEVDVRVTIIGDASSNERDLREKRQILSTIERCQLKPRVRMMGFQPYAVLFQEAYKHHIFLSPSVTSSDGDAEGGAPVSIIEMATTGMPVVSTMHCDIPEVAPHSLLAQERDVDGLVGHLKWLTNSPEKWRQMVESQRKHIEAEFDAQKQGERLAAIYKELVK